MYTHLSGSFSDSFKAAWILNRRQVAMSDRGTLRSKREGIQNDINRQWTSHLKHITLHYINKSPPKNTIGGHIRQKIPTVVTWKDRWGMWHALSHVRNTIMRKYVSAEELQGNNFRPEQLAEDKHSKPLQRIFFLLIKNV